VACAASMSIWPGLTPASLAASSMASRSHSPDGLGVEGW
jgi:hypothetical protein